LKTVALDVQSINANPVHRMMGLVKALQEEGIPAFGVISLEGVESGTLSMTAPDLATGKTIFTWDE